MTQTFRDRVDVSLTVNGEPVEARVPVGQHLIDFLRTDLGLTGAHASCEHGVCGACTLRVDGQAVRGCLMLAAQADGAEIWTVEGLTDTGTIRDLQDAFVARNALQCGFSGKHDRIAQFPLLRKLRDRIWLHLIRLHRIEGRTQEDDVPVLERRVGGLEMRQLHQTRWTPGRPEVQDHHLAFVVCEVDRLALEICQLEVIERCL